MAPSARCLCQSSAQEIGLLQYCYDGQLLNNPPRNKSRRPAPGGALAHCERYLRRRESGGQWGAYREEHVGEEEVEREQQRQVILDMSNTKATSGQGRAHWREYISHQGWEHLGIYLEEQEDVTGEKDVCFSFLFSLQSPRHSPR
ncbi:unnamed protein product [Pleuronectes platessa]|uniref:Uncharacterized protein n=1 Tax=Pleuronectes platessa TaxID=8262 RepID=A0A9N7V532_PLEPL|nr:unnamed protein product [Pleuronectes platessa]